MPIDVAPFLDLPKLERSLHWLKFLFGLLVWRYLMDLSPVMTTLRPYKHTVPFYNDLVDLFDVGRWKLVQSLNRVVGLFESL